MFMMCSIILDIYMIETHGQNEEWQSVLNAF
jgi:hypothetical protein